MLQVPMEPFDYPDNDPGPQTLLTSLAPDQNLDRLYWLMSRFAGYVGIYHFAGARDEGNAKRVDAAVQRGNMATVKSLRREPHAPDEICWLHAEGWCLSRRE